MFLFFCVLLLQTCHVMTTSKYSKLRKKFVSMTKVVVAALAIDWTKLKLKLTRTRKSRRMYQFLWSLVLRKFSSMISQKSYTWNMFDNQIIILSMFYLSKFRCVFTIQSWRTKIKFKGKIIAALFPWHI
jgi:hypothetical protein